MPRKAHFTERRKRSYNIWACSSDSRSNQLWWSKQWALAHLHNFKEHATRRSQRCATVGHFLLKTTGSPETKPVDCASEIGLWNLFVFCRKAVAASWLWGNTGSVQSAFVKAGFNNWEKAMEKFRSHEKGQFHLGSVSRNLSHQRGIPLFESPVAAVQ